MSLEKMFYLLKSAEGEAAEFYDQIRLDLSIGNPYLSDFFAELAKDERMHEKQVMLLQSIFLGSKEAFLEREGAERQMAEYLEFFAETRQRYERERDSLDMGGLLEMARTLEESLLEKHRTFFLEVTDPQVRQLLGTLNLADEYHLKRITELLPG